ncbi:hypothetical protein [Corynebacterium auriscanis]|uniref:hypothetical protein n=1 Tax=Corynebacterium auriscanis TaxID=99807 RepID=UPI0024ADC27B|nr:hypothetical protein [Corynebacterium auriscanis]
MITPNDVLQTMRAANPTTTTQEAEKYFQQIDQALDRRLDEVAHLLRQKWTQDNGREPDGLTWGRILNRAQIDAENQIRQEYLAELTEIAVQRQMEQELEDANRIDPELWKTDPWDIQVSDQTFRQVDEVWPDKPTKWTVFAGALFETMKYQDRDTPYYPEDEQVPALETMIDEAYNAYLEMDKQRAAEK